MQKYKFILVLIGIVQSTASLAQDGFKWWNEKHNWDGVTPWEYYLTTSPAYMGPNALPVPETKTGLMPSNTTLEISYEHHFRKGDQTKNLFASFFSPIGSDKAGFAVWMVPWEHYKMDTLTRDLRAARDYDGEGNAVGDVYVGTYIQLVKDKPKLPDILLTANIKTASGGHFYAARYIDAPGYYFDLSFGKTIEFPGKFISALRPYGMGGFYSWQNNGGRHYQNDAPMYGAGFYLDVRKKIRLDCSLEGYRGYENNGDRPLVYRAIMKSISESRFIKYKLLFEHGLHDFPYTSVRAGLEFDFTTLKQKISAIEKTDGHGLEKPR